MAEDQLNDLLRRALALIDEDAAAVRDWMANGARTMSTTNDNAGGGGPNVEVPLRMLSLAATAFDALLPVAPLVVDDLRSEVGAAAALMRGGAQSAALIARHNLAGAAAGDLVRDIEARVHQLTVTVERGFTALWSQANSPDRPGPP